MLLSVSLHNFELQVTLCKLWESWFGRQPVMSHMLHRLSTFVGVIFVCLVVLKYLNHALLYCLIVGRADSWYSIVVLFLFICTYIAVAYRNK